MLSRLDSFDVTWNYVDAAIWSAAEPAMSVIAACLPSLRPLVALIWKASHRGPSLMNSTKSAQATTSSGSSRTIWPGRTNKEDVDKIGGFTRLDDTGGGKWGYNSDIRGGKHRQRAEGMDEVSLEELNPPNGEIRVREEVVVTSEKWDYNNRLF